MTGIGALAAAAELVADTIELARAESPSSDVDACQRAADVLVAIAARRVPWATAEVVVRGGRPHVVVRGGGRPRVLLLGHLDTVWPLGTLAGRPIEHDDGRLRGPGVFDMKAGLVLALHAMGALGPDAGAGAVLLATSDEETGSVTSADLVRELAAEAGAVLVLEPPVDGRDGRLKVARKGVGFYRLEVQGRAAHAGLNPEDGVNALLELAQLLPRAASLADPARGTTVTPTLASAGSAVNVVPAMATADLDVRTAEPDEARRVDDGLRALRPFDERAVLTVIGGENRPPMPAASSQGLYALAVEVARAAGLATPGSAAVGGGSDGNLVAAHGVPVLDGLGPPGGGAHTADEHVHLDGLADRLTLVAGLVERLCARPD